MILTPHIIVGAMIGAKTKKPLLIIILGVLSHFILDKIPHWDYHSYFPEILIDIIIGLSIVLLIMYKKRMLNKNYLPHVILGIFASLLPDALWMSSSYIDSGFLKNFTNFHHHLHYIPQKEGVITFLGASTQIAVIIISLLLLFFS